MEHICLFTVSIMEFYRQFCSVPGVEPKSGKPSMFRAVQEQILCLYKDKKQPHLVDNLMTDALTLGAQMKKMMIGTNVILASQPESRIGAWDME